MTPTERMILDFAGLCACVLILGVIYIWLTNLINGDRR